MATESFHQVSSTASIAVLMIKPETTLTRRNFWCFTIFSLTRFLHTR